jgi:hypothetical protein
MLLLSLQRRAKKFRVVSKNAEAIPSLQIKRQTPILKKMYQHHYDLN